MYNWTDEVNYKTLTTRIWLIKVFDIVLESIFVGKPQMSEIYLISILAFLILDTNQSHR
jgi:hypothetical protein